MHYESEVARMQSEYCCTHGDSAPWLRLRAAVRVCHALEAARPRGTRHRSACWSLSQQSTRGEAAPLQAGHALPAGLPAHASQHRHSLRGSAWGPAWCTSAFRLARCQCMNSWRMNSQRMNSRCMNSQRMNSRCMNSQCMNSRCMNSRCMNSRRMNSRCMNSQL